MPVKVSKVACQQCGADLEVDENVRFVTCRYCSSRLEIVHDPSVSYSKILDDVMRRQDAVEHEVRLLRLERELRKLEETWATYRQATCRSGNGILVEPNPLGGYFIWVVGMVAMGFTFVLAGQQSALAGFGAALLVGGIAFVLGKVQIDSGTRYQRAQANYHAKRAQLHAMLHGLETRGAMPPMKRSGG
ncbi:hypothetical protein [Haloferula sargassicola]